MRFSLINMQGSVTRIEGEKEQRNRLIAILPNLMGTRLPNLRALSGRTPGREELCGDHDSPRNQSSGGLGDYGQKGLDHQRSDRRLLVMYAQTEPGSGGNGIR